MNNPIVLISIFRESLIGGVAVHSSNLYDRLLENGYEVERIDFAFVFRRPLFLRRFWIVLKVGFRLLRLRFRGAKIFHFHASNRALMYYLFAPMLVLTGGRVILSLHSGVGYDKWLKSNSFYHQVNKVLMRLLDRLVFMNPEESARIRNRYPAIAERIVTVNPFIAPSKAAIPDLGAITLPAGEMKIATIGVWEQRYNVEEAVLAAVRFQQETSIPTSITVLQSTIRLEPEYKKRVMAQIEEARKTIEVIIMEDSNTILQVLAEHDVFIRPSFLDSYGLCVAESLLVGTPAIATDVCRRCSQAMLYRRGNFDTLHEHLLKAYADKGKERRNLLSPTEDSFHGYEQEYRRLLKGSLKAPAGTDVRRVGE